MKTTSFKSIASAMADNKATRVIKKNPVATGVAGTYLVGSTLAYTAAGVAFKTALAYSVGVTLVYGSVVYGAYHLLKSSKQ